MKKLFLALVATFVISASASAMSYEQARAQALFLTDKMAYELNLTEEQYEAAYEINLDYLMNVNSVDDLYGIYWTHRNTDLSYILLDWQYRAYLDATYFYRPLRWDAGYWRFGIYARYPRRDYYYFDRPRVYSVYRGDHSWRVNGGRSWYQGRDIFYGRTNNQRYGMRDIYQRNGYYNDNGGYRYNDNQPRSFGNQQRGSFDGPRYSNRTYTPRESSTRTTVTRPNFNGSSNGSSFGNGGSFGGSRSFGNGTRSYDSGRSTQDSNRIFSSPSRSFGNGGSFGGSRSSNSNNLPQGGSSFGGHR